ncbi:TPA: hypothetical protein QB248_001159 [Pasteurella multocida]|nr:hypothetical protein [Pasteurella multocida]
MSNLTDQQRKDIEKIINDSLDIAERFWRESGGELEKEAVLSATDISNEVMYSEERISSQIPNHKKISPFKSVNAEMIAIVADMRGSTRHAKTKEGKIHPLKRIFLETSALLPAMEKVINLKGGNVTEYLGDGILGFFEFSTENIYKSYNAASIIITEVRVILNNILHERYELPETGINIGVGLAKSQVIIHATGIENKHPKAFGSCVYDATKLSSGTNVIGVSEGLKSLWPTSPKGTLQFREETFRDLRGYKINPKNN